MMKYINFRAILHNKAWKCPSFMKTAKSECLKVSDIFDMKPLICDAATKSAFLDAAPQATIIHIGESTWKIPRNLYIILKYFNYNLNV